MKKVLIGMIVFLVVLFAPAAIWFLGDDDLFHVSIINKTAPDETYREHHSLTWLLNHERYTKQDGTTYDVVDDYYGFLPNEAEESYDIRHLPDQYDGTDLIYVADTYGVYEEDLPWTDLTQEENPGPPNLIYGGFERQEWDAIRAAVEMQGTDLIMEFNSFASPTPAGVREDILEFLRADWDGWIGRHFNTLEADGGEIPLWVITRYEERYGDWTYEGEGFVLINDLSEELVILSEETMDVTDPSIHVSYTERGQEAFGLPDSPHYTYWFDILSYDHPGDVLAYYDWDLNEQGIDKLEANGIPTQFPAILHHERNDAQVYYFAGDYADVPEMPAFHQYSWYPKIRSLLSIGAVEAETRFFWRTYAPMMITLFDQLQDGGNAHEVDEPQDTAVLQADQDGIRYPARVNGPDFEVYKDGEWEPFLFKGINMGMAKPGVFPGEAAITRDEYDRWFEQIGELNVNVIRNYTLHPPAFYEALHDYNLEADEPLYLLHGVWIDEEPLEETLDAFTPEITEEFQDEIRTIVDVIHGNAVVEPEPGHASGIYSRDISPYVIGWVLGIEWYPVMVDQMLQDYPDLSDYSGDFVFTESAEPMEIWMADQFEFLMDYEIGEYESMRPLSFTNWVTTDNIDQPAEPNLEEDMATVDPNTIRLREGPDEVGMFASYHVYPYYPDFLNIEERYTTFIDHRGEPNNYAGYLHDLEDAHDIPVLVAEFGIPASRGLTHRNPFGWNQGFIEETEQGDILVRLYEDIVETGMLGGLIFTWQDEWFKRTWNTMDYDNPDRRPFWSNAQTNEQHFGLLNFDRLKVKINGTDDWTDGQTILDRPDGRMTNLTMDHDERYLYVKSEFAEMDASFWDNHQFEMYLSTREEEGIDVTLPGGNETLQADFHLTIDGRDEASIRIAGNYDSFLYDYRDDGFQDELLTLDTAFHPIRLALNREQVRPDTGEILPFEAYEAGELRFGIGDPAHDDHDSLSDYYFREDTGILEIRIPWMLLNARDPSQREFMGNVFEDGTDASVFIEGIDLVAMLTEDDTAVASSMPVSRYVWDTWDLPQYEERLKDSYEIVQELFRTIDQ